MLNAVEQVLAERRRRSSPRGIAGGVAVASFLHALALAALVLSSATPPPPPLEFVPVRIVPLQALGSPRTSAPPAAAKPPPEPIATPPEREAPPPPPPAAEKPRPPAARTKPADKTSKAGPAAAPGSASEGEPAAAGREGSPLGSREGVSALGATLLEGIDPDFTYDYYLDRMLAAIGAQWIRPPTEGEIRAVLHFTVEKGGEITALAVAEPSGYPAFDLAALRAVQNASPLPRLPASYLKGSLSVTLIVR
jgi:TonB family protein